MTGFAEESKKEKKKSKENWRKMLQTAKGKEQKAASQSVKASPLSKGGTKRGRIKNTEGQKLKTKVSGPWGQRGGRGKDGVSM